MKKNYIFKFLVVMMFFASVSSFAQSSDKVVAKNAIENIEGLTIFPNPVTHGKVHINTKHNLAKNIDIYDVLGKKVISQVLYGKELNIQNLNPGVYILKIKEGKHSATRKLVVR